MIWSVLEAELKCPATFVARAVLLSCSSGGFGFCCLHSQQRHTNLRKPKEKNEPIMLVTVSMEVNAVRLLKLPALHGRLWVSSGG